MPDPLPALRSPYVQTDGLFYFARMLDKIRLHRRGELPAPYHPLLGKGFDGRLCRFLGIPYDRLAGTVTESSSDAEALAWCRIHGTDPSAEQVEVFNAFLSKRGWRDATSLELVPRLAVACHLDDDGSLETAFDTIERDEGRPIDGWCAALGLPRMETEIPPHVAIGARIFQRHAQPMSPLPTEMEPRTPRLEGIRAVVFDIYGTLVTSGTGDISLAANEDRSGALRAALATIGLAELPSGIPLVERFHTQIRAAQDRRRADGIEYPEVEIREVWHHFLADLAADGLSFAQPDATALERLAIDYECRVNPVWPMPHLSETLAALRLSGKTLGIVSNAQFYTRLMFPAFLGVPMRALGFPPDLCIYSYRLLEGKPSTGLYTVLAEALKLRGIEPGEVLYVGNDLRNDIWPAQTKGFRTALFAGDRRSLRLRPEDPRLAEVVPDGVVTDLWQLTTMV